MYEDYEIPTRELSEEDALAMLNESYRQLGYIYFDNENPQPLTFDTTIAEFESVFDTPKSAPQLGRILDEFFHLEASRETCAVLHPPKKRTLGEFCRYIASRQVQIPAFRPVAVLGSECAAAGAFVTIRALLRDRGADVREIAPSTPLHSYARLHREAFYDLGLIVPGRLPLIRVKMGLLGCIPGLVLLGVFLAVASFWLRSSELFTWGCGLAMWPMGIGYLLSGWPPREVLIGDLKTFRDLCDAITRPAAPIN